MTEQQQNCDLKCLRSNSSNLTLDLEPETYEKSITSVCTQTNDEEPFEDDEKSNQGFWVFGYGSLIWKVDFPIETSLRGYITGYQRRFYQNSIDHRGTVEKPGRVVTLIQEECSTARVYGVAYKIADDRIDEVMQHLDYREKNGYDRLVMRFNTYPAENAQFKNGIDVFIYLATPDNDSFAGPTEMRQLAKQIFDAVGPSGPNTEYVFQLADAMRRLFPDIVDEHLMELENVLRQMELDH